jgi:hypothetical protein
MAKFEDLITRIPDEGLRKALAREVKTLKKTPRFGLVFEEHLPETARRPRLRSNRGVPALSITLANDLGTRISR